MKRIGLSISLLALLCIVLPSLTAQDEKKKDQDTAEKKDEAKKDEAKKDEAKKDEAKKKDETKKEKLNYGNKFVSKILSANAANGREFTVELREIDQKKVTDVQTWQAQRSQQLAQQLYQVNQQFAQANTQKDFKARLNALANANKAKANYDTDVYKFQVELAKKDVYSAKPFDVRAHDDAKVRSMHPPVEFDDNGFQKKWTKKELEERRDKTGLPGFAVDFDQLKSGQTVEIYMVKVAPAKNQPKKKKGPDDDPVPPEAMGRPEFIMIVILQEPALPK